MKKKLICMGLAALMILGMAGCGSSAGDSGTTDKGTDSITVAKEPGETFVVGFDQDFPPMGFVSDDGGYTGFDIELAEKTAEIMGMEFVPQPIAWDSKDAELKAGNIDCIWNGFTIQGREDNYTWTEPYLKNSQVFVVKKDSGISSPDDLAGKIVGVQVDSSAEAALNENTELSSTFEMQTFSDYNVGLNELASGSVDAVAMDIVVAEYQLQQRSDGDELEILDYTIADEEYGVGFLKGNTELRDMVQDALYEMKNDGTLAEISTEWFGSDLTVVGENTDASSES